MAQYVAHNALWQVGELVVLRVKVVLLTCIAPGDSSLVVTGLLELRYMYLLWSLIRSITTLTK